MNEVRRRHLATEPGQSLILPESAPAAALMFDRWQVATGATPVDFDLGILCTVPIPQHAASTRHPEILPEAMWCPMFWLPHRLSNRWPVPGPAGSAPVLEDMDDRGVRIGLELAESGLYEPEEGWVDVLWQYGIDTLTEEGVARVAAWQAGGVDELLSSISLDEVLNRQDDPLWAFTMAKELSLHLRRSLWAIASDSLIGFMLDEAASTQVEPNIDALRSALGAAMSLAVVQLRGAPVQGRPAPEVWEQLEAKCQNKSLLTIPDLLDSVFEPAIEQLYRVRTENWPHLQELTSAIPEAG